MGSIHTQRAGTKETSFPAHLFTAALGGRSVGNTWHAKGLKETATNTSFGSEPGSHATERDYSSLIQLSWQTFLQHFYRGHNTAGMETKQRESLFEPLGRHAHDADLFRHSFDLNSGLHLCNQTACSDEQSAINPISGIIFEGQTTSEGSNRTPLQYARCTLALAHSVLRQANQRRLAAGRSGPPWAWGSWIMPGQLRDAFRVQHSYDYYSAPSTTGTAANNRFDCMQLTRLPPSHSFGHVAIRMHKTRRSFGLSMHAAPLL
ncbi:hypothetical protein GE09DRAFT_17400 [Coniochaeta sp. 2T2.1]|nr:hypothetical protein GE09DRAFT_17400 [Coniochaeta sp. 2T2.1]